MELNKMKSFIVLLICFQIVNAAQILEKMPRNSDQFDASAFDESVTEFNASDTTIKTAETLTSSSKEEFNQFGANVKDSFFLNPLHWAAKKGNVEMVRRLIDNGADVNGLDLVNRTALHAASHEGQAKTAEILIDRGASLNPVDTFGYTPLHLASLKGKFDAAKVLVDHGADVNAIVFFNRYPLHLAAKGGEARIVKLLLEKGVQVDVRDGYDFTPLHVAAHYGKLEAVKALLDGGADINSKVLHKKTALQIAMKEGHSHIVKFLTEKGAQADVKDALEQSSVHFPAGNERISDNKGSMQILRDSAGLSKPAIQGENIPNKEPIAPENLDLEFLRNKINTFKAIIENRERDENAKPNDSVLITYDFDDIAE